MNFSFFVAKRLFRSYNAPRKVSLQAVRIATAGVAVGIAVMIISVSVVLGFKSEIRSKVIGFGSHVQIRNYSSFVGGSQEPISISSDFLNDLNRILGVKHVQRFCDKEGILKTEDNFKGILLHGVESDYSLDFLKSNLLVGTIPDFKDSKSSNKIVISKKIADDLQLNVGDKVYAYFFDNSVRTRRFSVSGIYRSNLVEFDNVLVYTDIYTVKKLNAWDNQFYNGVEIEVDDFSQLKKTTETIQLHVNRRDDGFGNMFSAFSIHELYPQIFSWLNLLDMNVWVILALMVAVAGFTMISGLLIIILERTNFIGIMKALGANNVNVSKCFLYLSSMIMFKGMILGNVLGLGFVILQKFTGLIRLDASTYYVDVVPVLLDIKSVIAINFITAFICLIVLIIPCYLISRIHPAKSIRFE